jgi:hypothetical protein
MVISQRRRSSSMVISQRRRSSSMVIRQRRRSSSMVISQRRHSSSLVAPHPLTLACDVETRLETRVLSSDAGRALVAGAGWEGVSVESQHPCHSMSLHANPCESPVALKSLDAPEAKHEGPRCVHHVGAVRERAHEAEAVVHLATGDQLHFLPKSRTNQQ